MKSIVCTIALGVSAIVPGAYSEVPPGPDAIDVAFSRMLGHAATAAADRAVNASDPYRTAEGATRNEVSSLELGFAHMLARRDAVPTRSTVRGEPDPVAVTIDEAVRSR